MMAAGSVWADNTTAGGGMDLLGKLAEQLQGDLDSFAELTGQVLDMIEQGQSIIEQGQAIINGFGPVQAPNLDRALTLGTICLSDPACRACAQPPTDLESVFAECGELNAFYDPNQRLVIMCYELLDDPSTTDEEHVEAVIGAGVFIYLHELGHAFRDLLDLPLTGREEDAVDELATIMLIAGETDTEQWVATAIDTFGAWARNGSTVPY